MTHRPSTFFVSDTHFFHHNIIVFDETRSYRVFDNIESHNEELIARWNSVVHPKDTVWHLGDFSFGNKRNIAIAERLHGKKNLLLGNHDMHPVSEYLVYFNRVAGVAEYKGAILSHVPVHESQMTRFKFNVHGHIHERVIPDKRYVNISVEQTNLFPVTWEWIVGQTQ